MTDKIVMATDKAKEGAGSFSEGLVREGKKLVIAGQRRIASACQVDFVDPEIARNVIREREPIGLFMFWDRDADLFIGVDNSEGDAWVEEFDSFKRCLEWLERK